MGWLMNALYLGIFVGVGYQILRKLAPNISIGNHINIKKISEFQKKNRARKMQSLKDGDKLLDLELIAATKQAKIAKAKKTIQEAKPGRVPSQFGDFGGNGGIEQGDPLESVKRFEKHIEEMDKKSRR